jgi:hypothetical protein
MNFYPYFHLHSIAWLPFVAAAFELIGVINLLLKKLGSLFSHDKLISFKWERSHKIEQKTIKIRASCGCHADELTILTNWDMWLCMPEQVTAWINSSINFVLQIQPNHAHILFQLCFISSKFWARWFELLRLPSLPTLTGHWNESVFISACIQGHGYKHHFLEKELNAS